MDNAVGDAKSCYLLEFSVQPGGARLGDVHVYGTLSELRAGFDRRYLVEEHGVDGHLLLWYGAILHLWAVRHGQAVAGLDLRRYLRTGDETLDRVVARIITMQDKGFPGPLEEALENLVALNDYEPMPALPEFGRLLELYDGGAGDLLAQECARLKAERAANRSGAGGGHRLLSLDWAAIEADLPVLPEPVLTTGEVTVAWPQAMPPQPEGYIPLAFNDSGQAELHAGLNDLECGEDEYPQTVAQTETALA